VGPAPQAEASNLGIGAEHICIEGTRVRLPAHIGFDPGGMGKGLAADLVCAELLAAGATGACVNLGGDLRVAGEGPAGAGWTVAVEHPWDAEPVALLGIRDGAVATSTTLRRRWLVDGEARHHLIDPQTGQPSGTDLTLACVVAGEAWMAETLAKAVILAGSTHPFDLVDGTGAEAVVVDNRGIVSASAGLARYLGGHALPPRIGADFADAPRPVPASDRTLCR
jgi:thiamine biosynthesis lipoprotein